MLLGMFGTPSGNVKFDNSKAASPSAWTLTATHQSATPRWQIRKEPSAPSRPNVLELESPAAAEGEYPLALYNAVNCRDGEVSVKFQIENGPHARAAGIVWRYQDPNNYYLLEVSADRHSVIPVRVRDGHAEVIAVPGAKPGSPGIGHDVRSGKWYIAKVVFRGDRFVVYFGNRKLMDVKDSSLTAAGKTGIWVEGRTAAAFDDFRIDPKS